MQTERQAKEVLLKALKEAYFKRLKKEQIGSTPKLTQEIDMLEYSINEMKKQIAETEQ